jgi:serine/threonine protein kinase
MAAMSDAADPSQPTDQDIVQQALEDEYEVIGELGRGGMAIVYKAREKALEREVAVKVLPFSLSHDSEFVERFEREARTAAKLEHPNIIPIYRVGRSGNVIYFVMKFLREKSLSEVVEERGKLEPREIRKLLSECASALGYANKHGIVHRDIKPDNIMFNEAGQAVLTDFGIAKAATGTRLTGTGMAIGTPYYMSPEQARAQSLDGRSDLYSLGVVAYQCLMGSVPFDGDDAFAISYKHIMEELPTPVLDSTEQYALFRVINKMMAKNANDRYQTAEELIEVLEGKDAAAPRSSVTTAATTPMAAVASPQMTAGGTAAKGMPSSTMAQTTPTTPMPLTSPGQRPVRVKKKRSGVLVGMVTFMLLGGAGGGGYYYMYVLGQEIPYLSPLLAEFMPPPDTAVVSPPRDSLEVPVDDSTAAPDSAAVADSAAPVPDSAAVDSTPSVTELPNFGVLVLTGLPQGARVRVNGGLVQGATHTLDAGSHRIEVQARGFEAYSQTALVPRGDTVVFAVAMTQLAEETPPPPVRQVSQCNDFNETYNLRSECFDARPVPRVAPLVPLTPQIAGMPTEAILAIQVGADGSVLRVLQVRPSNMPQFTILALRFAREMQFTRTW